MLLPVLTKYILLRDKMTHPYPQKSPKRSHIECTSWNGTLCSDCILSSIHPSSCTLKKVIRIDHHHRRPPPPPPPHHPPSAPHTQESAEVGIDVARGIRGGTILSIHLGRMRRRAVRLIDKIYDFRRCSCYCYCWNYRTLVGSDPIHLHI